MSRYGWSSSRDQVSPYTSLSSGVPAVTDEDFSYITSQDLDDEPNVQYYPRSSAAPPPPEDDVLLIKNKGVTYPAHFPAYTIGDGKLTVKDVRERIGLMTELSDRATRRVKLLYKGRQLKDPLAPVRDYGVKNNSELMAVIPDLDEGSSQSEEEMVIVDAPRDDSKSRRRKKRRSKKKGDRDDGSSITTNSPRDSSSTFDVPRLPPGPKSPQTAQPPLSGPGAAAMKQLADYSYEWTSKWLPLCDDFIRAPPFEFKKRTEEHRRITENVMQQILLKLDGVESEGVAEVRARRKALIQEVQDTLKRMDVARGPAD